jgi:hypothetical protein
MVDISCEVPIDLNTFIPQIGLENQALSRKMLSYYLPDEFAVYFTKGDVLEGGLVPPYVKAWRNLLPRFEHLDFVLSEQEFLSRPTRFNHAAAA